MPVVLFFLRYYNLSMLFKSVLKYKRLWVALSLALFLAVFWMFKESSSFSGFIVRYIGDPYRSLIGMITAPIPFSLAEFTVFFVVGGYLIYIVFCIIKMIRLNGKRLQTLALCVLNILLGVLIIATLMAVSWGANYYVASPVDEIATANPVSVEQLTAVTRLFAMKLSESAVLVERDENNVFSYDTEQLFAEGADIYHNLEQLYPSLQGPTVTAKQLIISPLMSEMNYTGFFFPLTAEANVNNVQPSSTIPSTIAHELAHMRGVAPEQDCNFLAVLACELSNNVAYQYSGQILAYINLANNLYRADYEAWYEISESLHPFVTADLHHNNAYWAQYDSVAADVADTLYEGFLHSHGQSDGLKSYGKVTDLLIEYYYDTIGVEAQ